MSTTPEALGALNAGLAKERGEDPEGPKAIEEKTVKKAWDEYAAAQAFDFNARKQYERDRRYAAGTADVRYAVDANLLGSYIDILVSYIYARNPKVSVRPAEQVEVKYDPPIAPGDTIEMTKRFQAQEARRKNNAERQAFAKTLQLVIQRLWLDGDLKKCMKKVVRSGFSVAIGWFKAGVLFDTKTDMQVQTAMNDLRDNIARLAKLEQDLVTVEGVERPKAEIEAELEDQRKALESQLEVVVRKYLAIDFISAEYMQVALDVRDVDDYCEAGWNANAIFLTESDARVRFKDVTDEEWKSCALYTQREPTNYQGVPSVTLGAVDDRGAEAFQYTKSTGTDGGAPSTRTDADGEPVRYRKVVELWDRRDLQIKTMIEGLKRWAKKPFAPPLGTSRFYPYFGVVFFPVDGDRHPQSLTWRLAKLQDEYANSRSNFRLARQRSIPGIIVNGAQVGPDEMKKLTAATPAEYLAVNLTEPERPIGDAFTDKPIPKLDPMLFDNALIIGDMEKLSGVQEALQTSQTVEKTATQAEIEQGGFAARTTAQRDSVEETLVQLARFTAEQALQGFTHKEVQRIAGPLAFWPTGLPIEAITQQLNVDIEAGSTGRPNTAAEREAWIQILPLIERTIVAVVNARAANQEAIAQVYIELLRETVSRFDDRIDVERFIPALPPMPLVAAGPGAGGPGAQPGAEGGAPAGSPPAGAPGSAPPGGAPNAAGQTDPLAAAAA